MIHNTLPCWLTNETGTIYTGEDDDQKQRQKLAADHVPEYQDINCIKFCFAAYESGPDSPLPGLGRPRRVRLHFLRSEWRLNQIWYNWISVVKKFFSLDGGGTSDVGKSRRKLHRRNEDRRRHSWRTAIERWLALQDESNTVAIVDGEKRVVSRLIKLWNGSSCSKQWEWFDGI